MKYIINHITTPHYTYLHANNRIDEEQHGNQQADVRQRLEWLHECPQQNANGVALAQQLDQSSRSEQTQKAHIECVGLRGSDSSIRGVLSEEMVR